MAEAHRDEIAKLEALYAANPEGRVFTHLAEAYRKAGDLDLAAQVLEQGLERHPDSASAYIVLGRVRFDRGERDQAARAFRRALELDSGNLVAHRFLGELAVEEDAPDEALQHYRELLNRNPGDVALQQRVDDLAHPETGGGEGEAPALAPSASLAEPLEDSAHPAEQPPAETEYAAAYGEIELAGPDTAGEAAGADRYEEESQAAPAEPDPYASAESESTPAVDGYAGPEYPRTSELDADAEAAPTTGAEGYASPDDRPALEPDWHAGAEERTAFEPDWHASAGELPASEADVFADGPEPSWADDFAAESGVEGEGYAAGADLEGALLGFPGEGDEVPTDELPLLDLTLEEGAAEPAESDEEYADLTRVDYGFGAGMVPEEEYGADVGSGDPDVLLVDPAGALGDETPAELEDDVGFTDLDGAFPPLTAVDDFEEEGADEALEEERAAEQDRVPADDALVPEGGLVTETMAELYRTQGFHARAADVYRSLLRERSEDERLQQRLAEVEAELGSARSRPASPDPESVESAFTGGAGAAGEQETPYAWSTAEDTAQGVPIGEYFRSLLSWRPEAGTGSDTKAEGEGAGASEASTASVDPWAMGAGGGEELLLDDQDAGWTPDALADDDVLPVEDTPAAEAAPWSPDDFALEAEVLPEEAALMGGELLLEPADPMPWDDVASEPADPAGEFVSPGRNDSDLMPWELPEPPGLEPSPPPEADWVEPVSNAAPAAGPEAGEAAAEEEGEDEDEDLEMFRSWLQSLKK